MGELQNGAAEKTKRRAGEACLAPSTRQGLAKRELDRGASRSVRSSSLSPNRWGKARSGEIGGLLSAVSPAPISSPPIIGGRGAFAEPALHFSFILTASYWRGTIQSHTPDARFTVPGFQPVL